MSKRTFTWALLFLSLLSCDSEPESGKLLIKEIEDPTCCSVSFAYQDGQLTTVTNDYGELFSFSYIDNKLVKIETVRNQVVESVIELEYNGQGQRSTENLTMYSGGTVSYTGTGTFTYSNGELKSIKYVYDIPEIETSEREFHWSNGNLTQIDYYTYDDNDQRFFLFSRMYIYDDKVNYSNQDAAFIYWSGIGDETNISKNNVVAIQDLTDTGTHSWLQYTYTYNSKGYPVGFTSEFQAGQVKGPAQIRYY